MPRKKPASSRGKPSSAVPSRARVSQLELLAIEAYAILCRGLTLYGIPIPRQRLLFKKSLKDVRKVTPISAQLLEQFRSVSELLTAWLQELPYVDATGRPKVLPIRGRGATFESLARQYLPERSIEEVVALACDAGSVDTLPGGRIAVYGEPMVNIAENPEATLAQAICHITNIIQTMEFNAKKGLKGRANGRVERLVNERLTPKQFEIFRRSIRPQLDALCEHADRILKKLGRTKTTSTRGSAGAGLGVYMYYRDDGAAPPQIARRARAVRRG